MGVSFFRPARARTRGKSQSVGGRDSSQQPVTARFDRCIPALCNQPEEPRCAKTDNRFYNDGKSRCGRKEKTLGDVSRHFGIVFFESTAAIPGAQPLKVGNVRESEVGDEGGGGVYQTTHYLMTRVFGLGAGPVRRQM